MFRMIATLGTIQAVAIFISLFRTKVLALLLGPDGVGVVSTIDQVIQSAAYFGALSIPFAAVKFLSHAHSEGPEAFRRSYGSFLKALLILSGLGTITVLGLTLLASASLGSKIATYRGYVMMASFGIPAMVLGGFFVNVLAAAQRSRASAAMAVVTNTAFTAAAVAGVLLAGIGGLYIGIVIAGAALIVGTMIYLRATLGLPVYDRTASPLAEIKRNRSILFVTVMQYLATAAFSASLLVARYTVLKEFGEGEAGLFQAALAIALSIGLVLNPANGLFLTPLVNRGIPNEEKLAAVEEFQRKLVLILSVAVMPLIIFPDVVLTLLFSTRFTGASEFVFLFVVWQTLVQLAGVYQALLIGFDDLKAYTIITCAGHLGSVCMCIVLVPQYGIRGVSIAFVVSNVAILLLALMRLRFKYSLRVSKNLGVLTCYSLAMMIVGGLVFSRFPDASIPITALKVTGYALFAVSLLCFLSKQERLSLYGLWARARLGSARAG